MRRKGHLIFSAAGIGICLLAGLVLSGMQQSSQTAPQAGAEGWLFDARDKRGVLRVKTKALLLAGGFPVKIAT
jgi:hypothetical protein